METPLDPDIVQHAMKVERTAAQGNEPQAYTPATELKSLKPWTMLALAALGAVIISLWTWHWQMAMTAILLVTLCVEIKILRRVRDACSMAWWCSFLAARQSHHPTHWLISTQADGGPREPGQRVAGGLLW